MSGKTEQFRDENYDDDDDEEYDDEGNVVTRSNKPPPTAPTTNNDVERAVPVDESAAATRAPSNNGAPTQSQSQQQSTTKKSSKKSSKTKKKEINPDFKDVHETGKWGSAISKKEMYIVMGILALVVIGVIIAVVVVVTGNKDDDSTESPPAKTIVTTPPRPTNQPTLSPTFDQSSTLTSLINQINQFEQTKNTTIDIISNDISVYDGTLYKNTSEKPQLRAIDWILNYDSSNEQLQQDSPFLLQIYALVVLYYNTNGQLWTNSENWLSSENVCTWYGINCDIKFPLIEEIFLNSNNLDGTLMPDTNELGLLQDLKVSNQTIQSLYLQDNKLTGLFPETGLTALSNLIVIHFEDNMIEGDLPGDVFWEETNVEQFYVHGNLLEGRRVPTIMCTKLNEADAGADVDSREGYTRTFFKFGIDCSKFSFCTCCTSETCYDE